MRQLLRSSFLPIPRGVGRVFPVWCLAARERIFRFFSLDGILIYVSHLSTHSSPHMLLFSAFDGSIQEEENLPVRSHSAPPLTCSTSLGWSLPSLEFFFAVPRVGSNGHGDEEELSKRKMVKIWSLVDGIGLMYCLPAFSVDKKTICSTELMSAGRDNGLGDPTMDRDFLRPLTRSLGAHAPLLAS